MKKLLVALLLAPALFSAPAYVQNVTISGFAPLSVSTNSATFTTGHNIGCFITASTADPVTSVTDAGSTNTYVAQAQSSFLAISQQYGWWLAKNIAGFTGTITAHNSGGNNIYGMVCTEISGTDPSSPVDVNATTDDPGAGSTTATSAPFTTAVASEIALVGITQGNFVTHTAGTGYTLAADDGVPVVGVEYQVFSSIQTGVTASATIFNSQTWGVGVLTLKAANSGTMPMPPAIY